ncbi:MAG: pilus assembly protein [Acidimicrobiales bacterium]|nr:pilus assembly protein [Acidimicrobiales bacterium]
MLVEAAFVLPILALVMFGILEYGVAFKNGGMVSQSSRAAARAFAAEPRSDEAADAARFAAEDALNSLVSATPLNLYLYRANPTTGQPCSNSGCTGSSTVSAVCTSGSTWCLSYTWNAGTSDFVLSGGSWPPSSRNACLATADSVGAQVSARYNFFTNFFGSSTTLTDRTMMRLEPMPVGFCAPT